MTLKAIIATTAGALLIAPAADAQVFAENGAADLDLETFRGGFAETGIFGAWDADDEAGLDRAETAAGMFVAMDRDDDLLIDEAEYERGMERWYGPDFEVEFSEYDADGSGFVEPDEFGASLDEAAFAEWDLDDDEVLTEEEFTNVIFGAADLDDDMVITIEEEGWFEGWFDGNDWEVEIEKAGEAM